MEIAVRHRAAVRDSAAARHENSGYVTVAGPNAR
jgi:hypothetical protein